MVLPLSTFQGFVVVGVIRGLGLTPLGSLAA